MLDKLFSFFGRSSKKAYIAKLQQKPNLKLPEPSNIPGRPIDGPVKPLTKKSSRTQERFRESIALLSTTENPLTIPQLELQALATPKATLKMDKKPNSALEPATFSADKLRQTVDIVPYYSYKKEAGADKTSVVASFILGVRPHTSPNESRYMGSVAPNGSYVTPLQGIRSGSADMIKVSEPGINLDAEYYAARSIASARTEANDNNIFVSKLPPLPILAYEADKVNPVDIEVQCLVLGYQYLLTQTGYAANQVAFHGSFVGTKGLTRISTLFDELIRTDSRIASRHILGPKTASDYLSPGQKKLLKPNQVPIDQVISIDTFSKNLESLEEQRLMREQIQQFCVQNPKSIVSVPLARTSPAPAACSQILTTLQIRHSIADIPQASTQADPVLPVNPKNLTEDPVLEESMWRFAQPVAGMTHARIVASNLNEQAQGAALVDLLKKHLPTAKVLSSYFVGKTQAEYDRMADFLSTNLQKAMESSEALVNFDAQLEVLGKCVDLDTKAKASVVSMRANKIEDEGFFRVKKMPDHFVPLFMKECMEGTRTPDKIEEHLTTLAQYVQDQEVRLAAHNTPSIVNRDSTADSVNALYKRSTLLSKPIPDQER